MKRVQGASLPDHFICLKFFIPLCKPGSLCLCNSVLCIWRVMNIYRILALLLWINADWILPPKISAYGAIQKSAVSVYFSEFLKTFYLICLLNFKRRQACWLALFRSVWKQPGDGCSLPVNESQTHFGAGECFPRATSGLESSLATFRSAHLALRRLAFPSRWLSQGVLREKLGSAVPKL